MKPSIVELPSHVRLFERLMYRAFAVLLLGEILIRFSQEDARLWLSDFSNYWPELLGGAIGSILAFGFFFAIFWFLVTGTTRQHRNWARWVWLVFGIALFRVTLQSFSDGLLAGLWNLAIFAYYAAALFNIFTGNARSWFGSGAGLQPSAEQVAISKSSSPEGS